MRVMLLVAVIVTASCRAADHTSEDDRAQVRMESRGREAVAAIGDSPRDMSLFAKYDCERLAFIDCTAQDSQGRQYVFFDGALSRISMDRHHVKLGVELPAGMHFGEDIETSRRKASDVFQVAFHRGMVNGRVVYSSDFSIRSPAGISYALELLADDQGQLEEVIQRTDY